MPEDAPTGAADDGITTTAGAADGGSGTTSSATGSQADAVTIAAERDAATARARQEQARADRAEAALKAATAPKPETSTVDTKGDAGLTPQALMELLDRRDSLREASTTLRTEFPNADPQLFSIGSYESAEQMRAKVEDSHKAFQARLDALEVVPKSQVEAMKQAFVEKYGPIEETPVGNDGGTATGEPTPQEVRAWSMDDMDRYAAQHGEDKLAAALRSAG